MRHFAGLMLSLAAGVILLHACLANEPPPNDSSQNTPFVPPTPADLITDARLRLIEQGLAGAAPRIQPPEAIILLTTLKSRIEKTLADGNNHTALSSKEPVTLEDFDKVFWSMHVYSNQISGASRLFGYTQQLLNIARKYKPKPNNKIDLSVLQTDWSILKASIQEVFDKFALRDRDLRIARVNLADKVLTDGKDVSERLLAALALDMDGDVLPQLLSKDTTFAAEETQKVKETIQHARTQAGPELLKKSRALFTGLHWWVRGRYGIGTSNDGLLKDSSALQSPEAMFGLIMPLVMPTPTPPSVNDPIPNIDRRHHYLWQFETRQFNTGGRDTNTKTTQFVPISSNITYTTHFY